MPVEMIIALGIVALLFATGGLAYVARAILASASATRDTAHATQTMALATVNLAEAARQQRLDAVRPVVVFRLAPGAHALSMMVNVANAGVGPALDLRLTLDDSPLRYGLNGASHPLALEPGGRAEISLLLSEERPFQEADHLLRWPRDDEEAALIAMSERPSSSVGGRDIIDPAEHLVTLQRLQDRYRAFRQAVVCEVSQSVHSAGRLVATYRDIHGRVFRSNVEILLFPDDDAVQPPAADLGGMSVTEVISRE